MNFGISTRAFIANLFGERVAIKLHDGRKMRYGIHPVDFHGKSSVKSNITCHIAHTCVRYTRAICGNSIRVQQIA